MRALVRVALAAAMLTAAAGCGGDAGDGDTVAVTLITKDSSNPFFVAMQNGAKEAATAQNVELTVAAGRQDGDEEGQIQAIENAIAAGEQGILITPNGPGVNPAIKRAREAGLYVIALDTPPDPADTVDITYATDNVEAGRLIGAWTAARLAGKPAVIAMLDLFTDKIVSVDYHRDQGFLTGMGIPVADPKRNGDEAPTGSYAGGTYTIVCHEPTNGAEDGGRTAMERCLTKNPDINVVYTINEPAANGAYGALGAAGNAADTLIVSIDGGCEGVRGVKEGRIDATSQQYPLVMARDGLTAIAGIARGGEKPTVTAGLDFVNTGVALVTDTPADGVPSIDTNQGASTCWG